VEGVNPWDFFPLPQYIFCIVNRFFRILLIVLIKQNGQPRIMSEKFLRNCGHFNYTRVRKRMNTVALVSGELRMRSRKDSKIAGDTWWEWEKARRGEVVTGENLCSFFPGLH
jgi:hypothetical protein